MQSNAEKTTQPKGALTRAEKLQIAEAVLLNLDLALKGEDVDDVQLMVSQLHSKIFVIRSNESEAFKRNHRRVPHGVIPDEPIIHPKYL